MNLESHSPCSAQSMPNSTWSSPNSFSPDTASVCGPLTPLHQPGSDEYPNYSIPGRHRQTWESTASPSSEDTWRLRRPMQDLRYLECDTTRFTSMQTSHQDEAQTWGLWNHSMPLVVSASSTAMAFGDDAASSFLTDTFSRCSPNIPFSTPLESRSTFIDTQQQPQPDPFVRGCTTYAFLSAPGQIQSTPPSQQLHLGHPQVHPSEIHAITAQSMSTTLENNRCMRWMSDDTENYSQVSNSYHPFQSHRYLPEQDYPEDAESTSQKFFNCTMCSFRSCRRYNRDAHERTHGLLQKPNRVTCNELCKKGCAKSFNRKTDWKRHYDNVHLKAKKFRCPNCGQAFGRTDTLMRHEQSKNACPSRVQFELLAGDLAKPPIESDPM